MRVSLAVSPPGPGADRRPVLDLPGFGPPGHLMSILQLSSGSGHLQLWLSAFGQLIVDAKQSRYLLQGVSGACAYSRMVASLEVCFF